MAKRNDAPVKPPVSLNAKSTPAEREAVNRAHHQEMAGHLISNTVRAKDGGHMLGRQGGGAGHPMPDNDMHLQSGAYIPRAAFAKVPQNTFADGNQGADEQPDADDYGVVDKKG